MLCSMRMISNLTGNGFGLGADGDEVWLLSADSGGALTGFIHGHSFGAADDGVSFGLHVTSTGKQHFVAQSQPSLGSANRPPRVGPVVIHEIFYHPAEDSAGEDVDREEYIELLNLSLDRNTPVRSCRNHQHLAFAWRSGLRVSPPTSRSRRVNISSW
jgi:hypothetical protein